MSNKVSPFSSSSFRCYTAFLVESLLSAPNIDIDACNRRGETALHLSAMSGSTEAVKLLLAKGANATKKDAFGVSVYMQALQFRAQCFHSAANAFPRYLFHRSYAK